VGVRRACFAVGAAVRDGGGCRASDFRDLTAREMPHLAPIGDEDAGNVTLPRAFGRLPGLEKRSGNALHGFSTP
jgi:hypothetical protein